MHDFAANLKPYSLGIVVETKPRGTDFILVSPLETLNIQKTGLIKDQTKDHIGNIPNFESTSFDTQHESKHYVKAKWLPYGESNRTSAPDVVRNETVMIYKFENVDEFFWFDIMREPELRRLEDVLYSYSNKRSGLDAFDQSSSYWVRYNTKDKYIRLHTSKNDGEPYEYDIEIDTKTGFINMRDDIGNFIELNSPSSTITLRALRAINLDAPVVNGISSNGRVTMNEKGVNIEGDRISNDTTVPGRSEFNAGKTVDNSHSRGNLDSSRTFTKLIDDGIFNYSRVEVNTIDKLIHTTTTDIETSSTTEDRKINS